MITFVVVIDIMLIDGDASTVAATNPCTHACNVATSMDHRDGRNLWNENAVALRVCRNRMRAGRLRDLLDQYAGRVDDAELRKPWKAWSGAGAGGATVPARSGVVPEVTLVEPDFVRPGDAADQGHVLGCGIDDQRLRVARIILRRAPKQQVVMRPHSRAVWPAVVQRHDTGVCCRVERADCVCAGGQRCRVDHEQSAIAGDRAG